MRKRGRALRQFSSLTRRVAIQSVFLPEGRCPTISLIPGRYSRNASGRYIRRDETAECDAFWGGWRAEGGAASLVIQIEISVGIRARWELRKAQKTRKHEERAAKIRLVRRGSRVCPGQGERTPTASCRWRTRRTNGLLGLCASALQRLDIFLRQLGCEDGELTACECWSGLPSPYPVPRLPFRPRSSPTLAPLEPSFRNRVCPRCRLACDSTGTGTERCR